MKIGILTYHRARNYGAFLQSISLCMRLNEEDDIEAEIIDYDMKKAQKAYSIRLFSLKGIYHFKKTFFDLKMNRAFKRGYEKTKTIRSEELLISDNLDEFQTFIAGKYDVIIVGSDEVWNTMYYRGFAKPYFLIGVDGCRKFSYAASARCDYNKLNENEHIILQNGLKEFEYISVRDRLTFNQIIAEGIDCNKVTISCDPSFLYDFKVKKKELRSIIKNKKYDENKKSILVLCENKEVCKSIRKELDSSYNLIIAATRADGYISIANLDPFEWMELIKSVDFVISSFFHGVCFSIINNTPFIAIASSSSRKSKLLDLLNDSTLENHFVDLSDNVNVPWQEYVDSFLKEEDYSDFVNNMKKDFNGYLEHLRNRL